jgi:hypothetical protein
MSELVALEPFPLESLTSYIRRAARGRFFTDTVSFLRASGVDWNQRSRDADLLRGPVLEQVAAGLGLEVDRMQALTVTPYIARLAEQHRGSLRWWTVSSQRMRMCDRCVAEEPYGRIHWRLPVITDCSSIAARSSMSAGCAERFGAAMPGAGSALTAASMCAGRLKATRDRSTSGCNRPSSRSRPWPRAVD